MILNIKRIIKSGFVNFWRNGAISLASVLVMIVSLFVVTSLVIGGAMTESVISLLKDKVDINVYIKTNTVEKDILDLKDKLSNLPEVKAVQYISKDAALDAFKERHKDNSLILSSLDELKDNPLGAVLSIKAKDPSQYEGIAKFLEEGDTAISADGSGIIDKINFYQNKLVIDRLTRLINATEKIGFSVSLVFAILAVIVTLNTIRLAIYTSKEEISVMRLVGASNWYIRGPFIVSGVMCGVIAATFTVAVFYPITVSIGDRTADFLGGLNLFTYYKQNILQIIAINFLSGSILGAISSYISVRRYLHV
ncbi:MAG: permease-like cell division protein FtsX [bacterium]